MSSETFPRPQFAKFAELSPTKKNYTGEALGIPIAAYEMLAAKNIYLMMAPDGTSRGLSKNKPAIAGIPGVEVAIVECPPGNGAGLHIHHRTYESFVCIEGSFEIAWGPDGENKTVLAPCDMVSIPPGVYRSFRNVGDKTARMLGFVQGPKEAAMNDIVYSKSAADQVEAAHGAEVMGNFQRIGISFAER
ncbi:cupin domain-containing protein [Ramlibacter sp. G-1-2-2]|uniref:Cupin domain-containing protein n=1 Tax=Ramlibacter agri TaxID=2728837 RepID=A0A848H112_9BURK|nr:cupin domain-containing protein [Ramlibacter agri]NML44157.1 cupin domain-containing protein [Ramlibacter agri]